MYLKRKQNCILISKRCIYWKLIILVGLETWKILPPSIFVIGFIGLIWPLQLIFSIWIRLWLAHYVLFWWEAIGSCFGPLTLQKQLCFGDIPTHMTHFEATNKGMPSRRLFVRYFGTPLAHLPYFQAYFSAFQPISWPI